MPKWPQHHLKSVQKSLWRRPVAIDSPILGLLERCPKNEIFDASPNAPKIRKIGAEAAQGAATRPRHFASESIFGDQGPWGGHARGQ